MVRHHAEGVLIRILVAGAFQTDFVKLINNPIPGRHLVAGIVAVLAVICGAFLRYHR
jgi:hypothetical protein